MKRIVVSILLLVILFCAGPAIGIELPGTQVIMAGEPVPKWAHYVIVVDKPIYFNNGDSVFTQGSKIWLTGWQTWGYLLVQIKFKFRGVKHEVYISPDSIYSISKVVKK